MNAHTRRRAREYDQFLRRDDRRELASRAHVAFDWLWKSGAMSRSAAYRWLAKEFDLPSGRAHIGRMPRDLLREIPVRVAAKLYRRAEPKPARVEIEPGVWRKA